MKPSRHLLTTIFLAVTLWCGQVVAQETTQPIEVPGASEGTGTRLDPMAIPITQPFLWEVTSPNGPTYLFGTIHTGVAAQELPKIVWERFRGVTYLAIEADVRLIDPFEAMAMAQLPEGVTLHDQLDAETWELVRNGLGHLMPETMIDRMQPWFLEMMVVMTLIPVTQPMDLVFLDHASSSGCELGFFEAWQDQMRMLSSLPLEVTLIDLVRIFTEREEVVGELFDMVSAYRRGDEEAITTLLLDPEEMAQRPQLYEVTIFQRNANWLPQIEEIVERGNAFVAVGLGHLLGQRGLVSMLRERGYTTVRLEGYAQ